MDPLTLALIFGGLGLTKALAIDGPKESRDRKTKAVQQRVEPLTHVAADQKVTDADPLGSTMQYGMTGLQLGQAAETHDLKKQLLSDTANLTPTQKIQAAGALTSNNAPNLYQANPWNLQSQAAPNLNYSPWYTV